MSRSPAVVVPLSICLMIASPLVRGADDKPDDALLAGTVWTGFVSGDERKAGKGGERGAVLKVVKRDGADFAAEFVVRGQQTFAIRLEGKVVNGRIAARVTKIIRGRWANGTVDDPWTGQVKGEQLVLQHTNKQNLTSTAELTLEKRGSDDTDRRKGGY